MGFDIKVIGADKVSNMLEKTNQKILTALPEELRDVTLFMQGQVKISITHGTNAPIAFDTGRFASSVEVDAISPLISKVYSDLEYAKYLEYGTSKMSARPHFKNTLFVNKDNLKGMFKTKVQAII